MEGQVQLRSKRFLIEKFINENLPYLGDSEQVEATLDNFWNTKREKALLFLSESEQLDRNKLKEFISEYLFLQRLPRRQMVVDILEVKPKLLKRKNVFSRVKNTIAEFIETSIEDILKKKTTLRAISINTNPCSRSN